MFFLATCFLEAWGTKANKPYSFKKVLIFGLAAFGGKATTTICFWRMCGFWPWHPKPPKKHLAKKPLRDPSEEHKVGDYQARGAVPYVRKRREAGETAYNDESTALTLCHLCKMSRSRPRGVQRLNSAAAAIDAAHVSPSNTTYIYIRANYWNLKLTTGMSR